MTWHDELGSLLARLHDAAESGECTAWWFRPAQTRQAIREFLERFPEAEYGGAHVILSDLNLESHWFGPCIRNCLAALGTDEDRAGAETIDFLCCLLSLEEQQRVAEVEEV